MSPFCHCKGVLKGHWAVKSIFRSIQKTARKGPESPPITFYGSVASRFSLMGSREKLIFQRVWITGKITQKSIPFGEIHFRYIILILLQISKIKNFSYRHFHSCLRFTRAIQRDVYPSVQHINSTQNSQSKITNLPVQHLTVYTAFSCHGVELRVALTWGGCGT